MADDAAVLERFVREFPAGTILFREGEAGAKMYVIRAGQVRISKRIHRGEKTLVTLGDGEFFGEMALVTDQPRTATATVIEDARLLELDTRLLEAMLRSNLEIAVRMIRRLAERLAHADRQIQMLIAQDHHIRVASYFLGVLEAAGTEHAKVDADIPDIGEETGCSDAQVVEALARLEMLGLVSLNASGGFSVLDRVGLSGYLGLP